jgi:predicted porin
MRTFVGILTVLFSILSNACPEIKGSFNCQTYGQHNVQMFTGDANVILYRVSDDHGFVDMLADGVSHTKSYEHNKDSQVLLTAKYTCGENSITGEEKYTLKDYNNNVLSFSNLATIMTKTAKGVHFSFNSTDEKQTHVWSYDCEAI